MSAGRDAPVTADTITDAQIRELRESASEEGIGIDIECPTCLGAGKIHDAETRGLRRCLNCGGSGLLESLAVAEVLNLCDEALGDLEYGERLADMPSEWFAMRKHEARARCAEIINARKAGQP